MAKTTKYIVNGKAYTSLTTAVCAAWLQTGYGKSAKVTDSTGRVMWANDGKFGAPELERLMRQELA